MNCVIYFQRSALLQHTLVLQHIIYQESHFIADLNYLKKCLEMLQDRLQHVKYIIIDEFSVTGRKCFDWIGMHLQQASGLMDVLFGGFSVIPVGDAAQLPPTTEKTPHNSAPDNRMVMMEHCTYWKLQITVKIIQNQCVNFLKKFRMENLLLHIGDFFAPEIITIFSQSYLNDYSIRLTYINEVVPNYN